MKTISEKLRSLAKKPEVHKWTEDDCIALDCAYLYLRPNERFSNMTDDEWGMFMHFVAAERETQ